MKKPAIPKSFAAPSSAARGTERGVTMVLVAVAMVAIVSMAALSIDVVTLYLDREEAQRSADSAALAAARVIALSGITGDPSNATGHWGAICGPAGLATQAAQATVGQNAVASSVPGTINVSYSGGSGGAITSNADCTTLAATAFGVNPLVTVKVTRSGLPTFFSRIWGNTSNSVSATATAEAFNPSDSGNPTNQNSGSGAALTPVQPMCVKPWVVPNQDPLNPPFNGTNYCNAAGGPGACQTLVNVTNGSITNPGISFVGSGTKHVIGETFWLNADCRVSGGNCTFRKKGGLPPVQPQANFNNNNGNMQGPPTVPNLLYVPGQVSGSPTAVPSCSGAPAYEQAITGCDQPTNYQCGVPTANVVDLSVNPNSQAAKSIECLTNQASGGGFTASTGQDYLKNDGDPVDFGMPSAYPFQILAGSASPLVSAGLAANTPITSSPSIVALPIYDSTQPINATGTTSVTFVGFLQVFINAADNNGNISVTVLNVAGCSKGSIPVGSPIPGTSPVPVRLITPP